MHWIFYIKSHPNVTGVATNFWFILKCANTIISCYQDSVLNVLR